MPAYRQKAKSFTMKRTLPIINLFYPNQTELEIICLFKFVAVVVAVVVLRESHYLAQAGLELTI